MYIKHRLNVSTLNKRQHSFMGIKLNKEPGQGIPLNSDNIKPWAYTFVQSAFCWAYFRGSLFSEGLIIGMNFAFQNWSGLTIKTAQNTKKTALNSFKQLTLTVHGLMFRRAHYQKDFCV